MTKLRHKIPPKLQTVAYLAQANPVSGTKYTVLDTTKNVRIHNIAVDCTWTVQPNPLEVHLTIDGLSFKASFTNPVSATAYFLNLLSISWNSNDVTLSATSEIAERAFLLDARSIKIEIEITGGTVSQLRGQVRYSKW